ncbi:hypothetical protein [Paraglaciecola chathamensis]|nr:hypothetical protein [Paraglaciecola agarilytica]
MHNLESPNSKVSQVHVKGDGHAFESELKAKRSKAYKTLVAGTYETINNRDIDDYGVMPSPCGGGLHGLCGAIMSKEFKFRLTKKHFNLPAVSINAMHYHIYEGCFEVHGDKLAIQCSFYQSNRRKWYGDTSYLTDIAFIKSLFSFGFRKGLISEIPEEVNAFIKNSTVFVTV